MFEVRCLVADKRLADVLRALRKLTLESPVTIAVDEPAVNGQIPQFPKHIKPKHGGVSARKTVEEFVRHLIKKGAKQITAEQLRNHMSENGFSAHSYSYPLSLLIKSKVLKNVDKGLYGVV